MKVPIDFTQMKQTEMLSLARRCAREFNDVSLYKMKIVVD